MSFPFLTYNEERPKFIGRDVEGIKELNANLAQKYDINKRATIETADLLHSFKTLDQDSPHLTAAIEGFDNQLQSVIDNNNYETAGQTIETAVTKIKRNKALEQSVANYGAYNQYVQKLKEDPKGWNDSEISNIIAFSLNQYGGVNIDKNGQAVGTFYGYDPGDKINILAKYDEGLKGFAADQNVNVSDVYNLLSDSDHKKGITTTTNKTITRNEIISYLKRYYKNDPEISKYYETKNILDSMKSGVQLSREFNNLLGDLDLFSGYTPEYKKFLKTQGVNVENQTLDAINFAEWLFERDTNLKVDIKGLQELAKQGSNEAKQQLAAIKNMFDKKLDFEAAAVKNGFSQTEAKHNFFTDELSLYKHKQLIDSNQYMLSFDGQSVNYQNKYVGNGGFKKLSNDIDGINALIDNNNERIEENRKAAATANVYDPVQEKWLDTNNQYYNIENTIKAQRTLAEQNLLMAQSHYDNAIKYANEKIGKAKELTDDQIKNRQNKFIGLIDERINKVNSELNDIIQRGNEGKTINVIRFEKLKEAKQYLINQKNDLENKGFVKYSEDLNENEIEYLNSLPFAGLFDKETRQARLDKREYDNAKQEYLDDNSIQTFNTTNLAINPEVHKDLDRQMNDVERDYSKNRAAYMVLDQDGNPIADAKKMPSDINIEGLSTGRFPDGRLYFEGTGVVLDENNKPIIDRDKRTGAVKKYFISATNDLNNYNIGLKLVQNSSPIAVGFGYSLIEPKNFRFQTENIAVANEPVPILNNSGKNLGTVEISSSTTNGASDFQLVQIVFKPNAADLNKYNNSELVPQDAPNTIIFNSRVDFESFLNTFNDIITK